MRVLVPCYKESLEILRRTIMAAYDAQLPEGCHRTIYLCDDGKDPKKRKWVDSLAADVVYVSGRKRLAGEHLAVSCLCVVIMILVLACSSPAASLVTLPFQNNKPPPPSHPPTHRQPP